MTNRLTFDDVQRLLPEGADVRPLLDMLLRTSSPDPAHAWSGSGELATVGDRLIDPNHVQEQATAASEVAARRLRELYAQLGAAILALSADDTTAAAEAFLSASQIEARSGYADRAAELARSAYRVLGRSAPPEARAHFLRGWARAERARGDLDAAMARYQEAREVSQGSHDRPGWIDAIIGAGNLEEQRGHWGAAEGLYREAVTLLDDVKPLTPAHWHAPLNLHVTLRSMGRVEECRSWLTRAREVASRLGDRGARIYTENAAGQLAMAGADPSAAETHFRNAVQEASSPHASVTVRLNLSEALLARGHTLDAAEEVRAAEREALTGDVITKLPEIYRMLGRIMTTAGSQDAFVLFERSLELARRTTGTPLEVAQTLQAYAWSEQRAGRDDVARQLFERALEAYRELGIEGGRRRWVDCFDVPFKHIAHEPPDPRNQYDAP